ncbi:MAG: BTAD domain-containing putative transcriptional regulator, partial [Candidatus Promineifilaceae bacterium]|nr:BTAD domain-containing putative transcriptional regulator [Candidatus Promineifilaceae bacterium]
MTNVLNIQMLGGFQLSIADDVIDSRSLRVQSLLAFLLLHRHNPQPRQQIASHLWPDSPDSQARANLRKLLHQLKQTLPDAPRFLQIKTDLLQWREDAGYNFDVAQFEKRVSQAKPTPPHQQEALLKQAADLYRGDLLPACYEEWIIPWREQLRQTYGSVLYDLVQLLEEQKKYRNAILYAQQLSQLAPLHEAVYRRLMRLHSLNGDRAGAIETFRHCERLLREELAIEPSAATRELYTQILAASRPKSHRHNLPQQLTSFIGREDELALIAERFRDEDCRLLTLVGPGGVGKTRLGLQAASALIDRFEDSVFFVSLEPVASSGQFVTAVAEALNFSFYSPHDLWQQVIDYLRQKQLLLVLDNFEHLLEVAGLLPDLLHHSEGVNMLITSRERLKLPQEWVLEIAGLPFPANNQDEALEGYGAVRLFLQRARQVRPELVWNEREKRATVRICRIL